MDKLLFKNLESLGNRIVLMFTLCLLPVIVDAQEFEAKLHWSKRVELSTPINGVVQEIFAKSSQVVAKGEVLLQLDPRAWKTAIKAQQAALLSHEEALKESQREMDRANELYDRTVLSDHDLQQAKNALVDAQAKYQKTKAALAAVKLNLEYSAIRAPFNAVVLSTNAVQGQVVSSKLSPPTLLTIAEAGRMIARIHVSAEQLNNIVSQQGAKVEIDSKTYQGKVESIGLEPDVAQNGKYAVDVIFDTGTTRQYSGKKVKVIL